MESDYPFGILDLRNLIIPLVSYIYGIWLSLWYLRFTESDYPFGILDLRNLIIPLLSLIYGIWLSLWYLRFTESDYPFGILDLRNLIIPLVSLYSNVHEFGLSYRVSLESSHDPTLMELNIWNIYQHMIDIFQIVT
jgi:hypothetical protein